MKYLIGIDDTDNLESRGTGWRARQLGLQLQEAAYGRLEMITRHQLLVDPAIPYTSHNSSACLVVESDKSDEMTDFCRSFLVAESADGSDAGLCIAAWDEVPAEIIEWGNRAKKEVLCAQEAHVIAEERNIFLEGLTGTKIGVIGSLAAVGLRRGGNDGRILWLPGLRELSGSATPAELALHNKIEQVMTVSGAFVSLHELIDLGDWVRPVMKDQHPTLFVEKYEDGNCKYRIAPKDFIKGISE